MTRVIAHTLFKHNKLNKMKGRFSAFGTKTLMMVLHEMENKLHH
jgi:hypothetical protein